MTSRDDGISTRTWKRGWKAAASFDVASDKRLDAHTKSPLHFWSFLSLTNFFFIEGRFRVWGFTAVFFFTSSEKNLKRISKNPLHCIKITKESYRLPKYILWNPLELEFTAARWIENKSLKSFCRRLFSPCLSLSCVYGVMLSCQLATAGRR